MFFCYFQVTVAILFLWLIGVFQVDGILFFKKDTPYVLSVTDEVLWIKPYMLPDVFDGVSVPKDLMNQKPASYRDFESFVDDVSHGRVKSQKKKKKVNKPFVPNVKLDLPPPVERPVKGGKKRGRVGQQGVRGRGRGRDGDGDRGNQRKVGIGDVDGRGDNYSRMLQGAGRDSYGKGTVSGYDYYGDQSDYYYPNDMYGYDRINTPGNQRDPFRMSDMQSALEFYNHPQHYRRGQGRTNHSRNYQLF